MTAKWRGRCVLPDDGHTVHSCEGDRELQLEPASGVESRHAGRIGRGNPSVSEGPIAGVAPGLAPRTSGDGFAFFRWHFLRFPYRCWCRSVENPYCYAAWKAGLR